MPKKKSESDKKPRITGEAPRLTSAQWWRAEEHGKDPHDILENIFNQIRDDQSGRYEAYKEYERLFGSTVGSNGDLSFHRVMSDDIHQNELQNTVETLWAQVFKNKIVPTVSASEADYEEWDRAQGYSRWLEGAFNEAKIHAEVMPKAGLCSLIHGTGLIRVGYKDCGDKHAQVTAWAVNPRFFYVDRLEAKHGKPRSIYLKDHIDRFVLYDMYSDDAAGFYKSAEYRQEGIMKCSSNDDEDLGVSNSTKCDMLTVKEAFHLPSGPRAKDGKHAIWIKGCTLLYEEFGWDRFPLVAIRFGVPLEGFYGESAVGRLKGLQKKLDKLNQKIDEGQDVMGVPRVIVRKGIGFKKGHLDDIPGGVLEIDGNPGADIKDWNAQCSSPEMYSDRDSSPEKMRQLLGIGQFEATGQVPERLRELSAPALERMVDQGTAKHAMFHGSYENAVTELGILFGMQAEDLQKDKWHVTVKAKSDSHLKTSMELLDFKDVMVDRRRMVLTVQPMSQFPQTFAGKVDAITKLRNDAKLNLNEKTAWRMLEVPDVSGTSDMLVSDEEIIAKNLSHMCRTGEYLPPMPFDNLDLIIQMTTRYINRYRVRADADNEVVGVLAQYIDNAVLLKKGLGSNDPNKPPTMPSVAAALGVPGPMPGVPMGNGGMPIDPAGMAQMGVAMQPPGQMGAPGAPMAPAGSPGMPQMAGPQPTSGLPPAGMPVG